MSSELFVIVVLLVAFGGGIIGAFATFLKKFTTIGEVRAPSITKPYIPIEPSRKGEWDESLF